MVSLVKVNKCKLKTIIKDDNLLSIINQLVIKVNRITTLVYQFIKSYYLYQLKNNKQSPTIDRQFVNYCFKTVTIQIDKRGKPPSEESKLLINDLKLYYDNHFSKLLPDNYKLETSDKMNYLFNYQIINILTAFQNNITYRYVDRLNYYVNKNFINDKLSNSEKIDIKKELTKVKNDLLRGTNTSDQKYIKWIENERKNNLPIAENHLYDLKADPFKYLNSMIYMNNYLESKGVKGFHCFPLRSTVIPRYIDIDTAFLIQLTTTKGTKKMLSDLGASKIIWDQYFQTNNKIFKDKKQIKIGKNLNGYYKFDGHIQTDGVGISIFLSLFNVVGNKSIKVKSNSYKDKNIEFPYLDELSKTELNRVKKGNKVYIDPGKSNIIYCIDDNNKTFKYSSKQRINETYRLKTNLIIDSYKKDNNLEKDICLDSSKTTDYDKFIKYVKAKNVYNESVSKDYTKNLFRNLRFRIYCRTKSSEIGVVNKMKELYGKNAILMYGDKNIGKQMRNVISSPMIGFKRMLKKHFKIYSVDEFRTSCLDYRTTNDKLIKNKNVRLDDGRKLHGILVSKISRESSNSSFNSYQNRDRNACLNIRKIVNHELMKGKGERPYWFRRNVSLAETVN